MKVKYKTTITLELETEEATELISILEIVGKSEKNLTFRRSQFVSELKGSINKELLESIHG